MVYGDPLVSANTPGVGLRHGFFETDSFDDRPRADQLTAQARRSVLGIEVSTVTAKILTDSCHDLFCMTAVK